MFTFRDVDDQKWAERSAPPHGVDAALHHAGVNADVDEGEAQDDEEHDVFCVPPEDRLLAEEEFVCQSEHEESETKNLDQNLQILSFKTVQRFSVYFIFIIFASTSYKMLLSIIVIVTYRSPELIECKILESLNCWLLEYGE